MKVNCGLDSIGSPPQRYSKKATTSDKNRHA